VRRALNLALDRRAVARLYGTRERATPTCQLLPPGLRSYHRYCPYTRDPRPNGAWAAPDVSRARRLIAASGTTGARVTLWSFTDNPYPSSAFWRPISRALRQIGLRVRVLAGGHDAYANLSPGARAAIGIIPTGWYADYPSPSNFYDTFIGCRATLAPRFYCDRQLDHQMHRAGALESSDSHTADALWSRIDRETVDRAAIVPLANPHSVELLSPRLHNYQYNPFYGFLASQAVVR
jgi:peptide/nickel transport system substrate-binding protein